MAQTYFQFRQFRINQDKTAMKVTTEACLFGAYISKFYEGETHASDLALLDIGAGTGLLSLMFIQKNPKTQIQAVEIDLNSALQCQENLEASIWNKNLKLIPDSIQNFEKNQNGKFNIIISNPPFHENQLKGKDIPKTLAHHSTELSLRELFRSSACLIQEFGQFWLLIPYYRKEETLNLAMESNFHLQEIIEIRSSPNHNPIRLILCFQFSPYRFKPGQKEIIIRNSGGEYTHQFQELLEDYYL